MLWSRGAWRDPNIESTDMIVQYDVDINLPEVVAQLLDCDSLRQLPGAAVWSDWENRFLITKERPLEVQIFSDDRAPKPDWHDQIYFGQQAPVLRLEHGRLKVQTMQWVVMTRSPVPG